MIKKELFFKAMISAFSVSMLTQVLGLMRQILIAAYFGISRNLDIYFMTYAIATLAVFVFGVIFDSVSIPHLVRVLEEKGHESFKELTGSIFSVSVCFAIALSAIFIIIIPFATSIMAVGFSAADKKAVGSMAFYFLPWTMIFLPYYALCSFFKSIRRFNVVFLGEAVMSLFSLVAIFLYHPDTRFLPLAYFIGYFFAFLMLFSISFRYFRRLGALFTDEMKKIYRNFIELFSANQVDSLSSIVERFLQSFLPSGGISVLAYSSQMTTNMSGLLGFRDIFLVPLSAAKQRNEKLERAVIGLTMITIPIMFFCSYYARDIVSLLFKRGKFDAGAVDIMAATLSVYILALAPAVVGVPAFRMFQVIDRIKNTAIVYLFNLISFAAIGTVLVFCLKLGTRGLALAVVFNAYSANLLSFYLLRRHGIRLNSKRVMKYASYACLASFGVLCVVRFLPIFTGWPIGRFLASGFIYCCLVGLTYLPVRKRISAIVYGVSA